MKVLEIAFSSYPVTDIARSRAFYEGVLSLKLTMEEINGESGGHWIEYDIGAGTLSIGKYPGWEPSSQGCTVGLEVEDFSAAVATVQSAGVTITMGPMETPVCHMLMIQDPDGNPLILHKRKPGHH
ncbi:MAG: VOC family protein [Akkermansiaceae bacterium]|nr:VOC family protein [Akkermansiaceae bacterium]